MNTNFKRVILGGITLAAVAIPAAQAKEEKVLDGCYTPMRGYAESATFWERDENGDIAFDGQPFPIIEQLGQYQTVFERIGWSSLRGEEKRGVIRRFAIEGPFRGKCQAQGVDPCASVNHVLGTKERDGFLFTGGDTAVLIEPPVPCDDQGGSLLTVEETLHPVAGEGAYQTLDTAADNGFVVRGTINQCTGLNDFDVVRGEGQICFWAGE